MASSKVMSTSRGSSDLNRKLSNSDFLRLASSSTNNNDAAYVAQHSSSSDHFVDSKNVVAESSSGLLTAIDAIGAIAPISGDEKGTKRSVDDVWREIVEGKRKKPKQEMMTLEDFLAKASKDEDEEDEEMTGSVEVKTEGGIVSYVSNPGVMEIGGMGMGRGRGKRSMSLLEPLDKAQQQRQRRMIKNRESAARSRERKQAYQVELESMAVRLEEENERLLDEKVEGVSLVYVC